jgi:tetraacyldisaccharide 4'-kinase
VSRLEALWYPSARPSVAARVLQASLAPAAGIFRAAVAARNFLFDAGLLRAQPVPGLRVLSVGNLTAGGAGKTPVVAFLAERLARADVRVAVLSRGYGRRQRDLVRVAGPPWPSFEDVGDEPLLLARRMPNVQVWVGTNRLALAQAALRAGATVALLDDGFQHRWLRRDADVVVLDEAVGMGSGHLLPWGPLREPASALKRASLLWVRVANRPQLLAPFPKGCPVVRARHAPVDIVRPGGAAVPLSSLAGLPVVAFCGIARPSAFEQTLRELGVKLVTVHGFPDHHAFTPGELAGLRAEAAALKAQLVTTEKDAMRLPADFPAFVVRLGVYLLEGEDVLAALLGRVS